MSCHPHTRETSTAVVAKSEIAFSYKCVHVHSTVLHVCILIYYIHIPFTSSIHILILLCSNGTVAKSAIAFSYKCVHVHTIYYISYSTYVWYSILIYMFTSSYMYIPIFCSNGTVAKSEIAFFYKCVYIHVYCTYSMYVDLLCSNWTLSKLLFSR